MLRPLIVIDVQRGNISEYNRFVPGGIASIIRAELFNPVIFTRYVNTPDSPARLFLETEHMSDFTTAGLEPKITEVLGGKPPALENMGVTEMPEGYGARRFLVTRNIYTAASADMMSLVTELGMQNAGVYLCGTDTECQVLKTALDFFEAGIEPMILSQFCGSHRGLGMHERGIDLLRELIGPERVVLDYMPLRQRWERQKGK
jgi:nicotinamidase-related amidase